MIKPWLPGENWSHKKGLVIYESRKIFSQNKITKGAWYLPSIYMYVDKNWQIFKLFVYQVDKIFWFWNCDADLISVRLVLLRWAMLALGLMVFLIRFSCIFKPYFRCNLKSVKQRPNNHAQQVHWRNSMSIKYPSH